MHRHTSKATTDGDRPRVKAFFHQDSSTFTYVVHHADSAVIIDPVLDYDAPSARTSTTSADAVIAYIRDRKLRAAWILETHAHADHLSAGSYLRSTLGAPMAIGAGIVQIQKHFKSLFNLGDDFVPDGRQFDRLLQDGDDLVAGEMSVRVLATPGHTQDGLTYLIGDAAFVGDTVFAPETGTARCDFPGGDPARLYHSIQKIFALPAHTRLFLCHDYPPPGRSEAAQCSIAAQREGNVHVGHNTMEAEFIALRRARDATLPPPRLILPALQVNIQGGRLPLPAENGITYLKLPLNQMGPKA
ncbi:MBL fold metallo-hydrolase [Rhodanobacter sp. MP7CTX1]|uniref:MBL fold metallo-hydrolase n=1 Tax=Rhodanobacter sp. MP7CTX1 TaxID=2723084 RepID=UPI001618424E|nr:glyoxylase-like metal-dependent hydrolase (beta-lactamase superfamily II) [Rhodanobacter sp. MP7CTX1]